MQFTDGAEKEVVKYKPYLVDSPRVSAQLSEDEGLIITHRFKPLNKGLLKLFITREEEIVRESEDIGKERSKDRFDDVTADAAFYDATIFDGLAAIEGSDIPPRELTYADMLRWAPETKKQAVEALLECKAKVIATASSVEALLERRGSKLAGADLLINLDWLLEDKGYLLIELLIGDPASPAYRLLNIWRRPEIHRRKEFREGFATGITLRGGDLQRRQTVINIRQGYNYCGEFFHTVVMGDAEYSDVVFVNPEWSEESGDEIPRVTSYTDSDRGRYLAALNPAFQVEMSAAVNRFFNKRKEKSSKG